jgi:hypothetical protein
MESKLDEILQFPQRLYVCDPDDGSFIEYNVEAYMRLLKPDIKELFTNLIDTCGNDLSVLKERIENL